jgi:hypothetical protein
VAFFKRKSREAPAIELTAEETELVAVYASLGMTESDVLVGMKQGIVESKADGTYWLPHDLGDLVLSGVTPPDSLLREVVIAQRAVMDVKRKDGMTDDDYRQYWNQPESIRRLAAWVGDSQRLALFMSVMESRAWDSEEQMFTEAAAQVNKFFGLYAHPRPDDDLTDPNRPLPLEVETRVTNYVDFANSDPDEIRAKLAEYRTVNAYYRAGLIGT